MKENRHLCVYCFSVWLNSVFVITFWKMLFNSNPDILIQTNNYNEFWFEFFLLNGTFVLLLFFLIKQAIECFKIEKEEK